MMAIKQNKTKQNKTKQNKQNKIFFKGFPVGKQTILNLKHLKGSCPVEDGQNKMNLVASLEVLCLTFLSQGIFFFFF
jgi:N12 class adenine-specific DNA methylase